MGDFRIGNVSLISSVKKNDRLSTQRISDPVPQLFPRRDRTGRIIWETKIDEIDPLRGNFRDKPIFFGAREVKKTFVNSVFVRGPGMAGHDVCVDVNRIDGVNNRHAILMSENIQNISAIAFGSIGNEDLVVGNIEASFAIVILCNGVPEK